MIRVLHFIPAYGIGGMESLVMSIYQSIDRAQVQFDFLVETQKWIPEFDAITALGGRVYQLNRLNKRKPWQYIFQLKTFFKEKATHFQVLHCHNIERSIAVLYYAKKYGINCRIFHAHTDSVVDARFERLTKFIIRLNNKFSTAHLACSVSAGDFYFKKDNTRYNVLKNAINTDIFSFNPSIRQKVRADLNLNGAFVIGHTGRLTYLKNHWKIIDVFKQVHKKNNKARLLLIGDGPLRSELEQRVENHELTDAVIFAGEQASVVEFLQCMDIFLLPSFAEGFCISLLEAQSVGLPCVVSDVIPKEVQLTDLINLMSLDATDEQWAAKIHDLIDHQRYSMHQDIIDSGYDIRENSHWLMNFYFEKLNKMPLNIQEVST